MPDMRVLFFQMQVSLLDSDLIAAMVKRGLDVCVEEVRQQLTPEGHTMEMFSGERIAHLLDTFKPDMVMTMNGTGLDNGGLIAREYERRGIVYASWFVDKPRVVDIGEKYVKSNSRLFTFDRAYIPVLTGAGFDHVYHLPLATNPDRFRPMDDVKVEDQVCFIGELDYKTIEYAARNIDAMVEEADENFYQCIEKAIQTQLVRPGEDTWLIIEETLTAGGIDTAGLPQFFRDILEGFVEREAGLRLRLETMKAVSAAFPAAVYGDTLWEDVLGHRYHGKVNYFTDEIVKVYNRYRIHINISKFQLRTAINQRPFDVPACGGFLITDIRDDLFDLFEPDEMASFDSTECLLDTIRTFTRDEALRREYVRKGRRRVLAEHTYGHRVDEILKRI